MSGNAKYQHVYILANVLENCNEKSSERNRTPTGKDKEKARIFVSIECLRTV